MLIKISFNEIIFNLPPYICRKEYFFPIAKSFFAIFTSIQGVKTIFFGGNRFLINKPIRYVDNIY